MRSFITAIAPMILLFAVPVLIPLVTVTVGALADAIRPPRPTAAEQAVAAAQARSAPWRAEMKRAVAAGAAAQTAPVNHVPPPPPHLHAALPPAQADQRPGDQIAA